MLGSNGPEEYFLNYPPTSGFQVRHRYDWMRSISLDITMTFDKTITFNYAAMWYKRTAVSLFFSSKIQSPSNNLLQPIFQLYNNNSINMFSNNSKLPQRPHSSILQYISTSSAHSFNNNKICYNNKYNNLNMLLNQQHQLSHQRA